MIINLNLQQLNMVAIILFKKMKQKIQIIYIEIGDKPTKVITKSDIYEYNFISMRDISWNIYFNTNRYSSNMRVKIQVSVEMDDETKKDFEDV